MNLNTIGIATGTITMLDGALQCARGEFKRGLSEIAFGASAFGLTYLYNMYSAPEECPEPIGSDECSAECPLDLLAGLASKFSDTADISRLTSLFNQTFGFSCENYFPGNFSGSTGYIDWIKPEDLSQSAMWGIDEFNRTFVALKYHCGDCVERVTAAFQRHSLEGQVNTGGHYAGRCFPTPTVVYADIFERLQELLVDGTTTFRQYLVRNGDYVWEPLKNATHLYK